MPSPFPGMDPYLEERGLWGDLHPSLIVAIRDALAPQVAPHYYVRIDRRVYSLEVQHEERLSLPDAAIIAAPKEPRSPRGAGVATVVAVEPLTVTLPEYEEVREGYLEIRDGQTHEVLTAIEVLSYTNKAPGIGRRKYEAKRRRVLRTLTNLVEIDLLRAGAPMAMTPSAGSDYRVLVSSGWEHPTARLYAFGMRQAVPTIPVPLRWGEADAELPLGQLLAEIYDRARYDIDVDYRREPPGPSLPAEGAAWLDALLRARGLRT
jgi:Protein of unknown function (DUF4058)